jgi:hypothetical protein
MNSGLGSSCYAATLNGWYTADCRACSESACGPQLTEIQGPCMEFFECACPGGTYADGSFDSCQMYADEESCYMVLTALNACSAANCTDCHIAGNSSSGG